MRTWRRKGRGISSWYRNLSRTNATLPFPPRSLRQVKWRSEQRRQVHWTISFLCLVLPMAQSQLPRSALPNNHPLPTLPPVPQEPCNLRPSTNSRRRSDWFVSNVLSHSPSTTSGPGSPAPGPRPPPTLADMLARDPPPNKSQEAYTPPTWIMLPPSNRGFRMLQKSGWSEGEPLGPYFTRRQDAAQTEQQPVAGPSNLGKRKAVEETRTTEIEVEGYDDIVEIKKGRS
jgi:hypothetical protein